MFKSNLIKSNHRVLRKNEVDTYEAPIFANDYSAIVLATSNGQSVNNRFLWAEPWVIFTLG
jgi:hypothetical protein